MKKISLKVAVCLLVGSTLFSSCFVGKYALFNKYINWQTNMTDNKFVNAIVALIIAPIAGSITTLVDVVVLNTVEFWSGSNPAEANIGKTRQVMGQDGRMYAVTTLRNGYEVKAATGELTLLTHDADSDSWSVEQNGVSQELFRYNADGTITANIKGESKTLTLNETGVYEARMTVGNGMFYAMN